MVEVGQSLLLREVTETDLLYRNFVVQSVFIGQPYMLARISSRTLLTGGNSSLYVPTTMVPVKLLT